MTAKGIRHFYIPEEQSVYLLSHGDAEKLKSWLALCIEQLESLGYNGISLIGKGAFGFVFAGHDNAGRDLVFKFSKITLPQHVQEKLEDEACMQAKLSHPHIPAVVDFNVIGRQSILTMERAPGVDLEQYSLQHGPLCPRLLVKILVQLSQLLLYLRQFNHDGHRSPIVHGDIKPSNLMWDEVNEQIYLIDWGSSVFAQLDERGNTVQSSVFSLLSCDLQQTNAQLGDIYFIGEQQLNGELSTPRFDEQGLAGTLYALASGQSARFAHAVITCNSLGLPPLIAQILTHLMDADVAKQHQAGDYLLRNLHYIGRLVLPNLNTHKPLSMLPIWLRQLDENIETVVYSSRKSFLYQQSENQHFSEVKKNIEQLDDVQFERYYKNYLEGLGDREKAFLVAVSRLAKYPVVGGIVIHWDGKTINIDSSLNLFSTNHHAAFTQAVNALVLLARSMEHRGLFKCCFFNAKNTLHLERCELTQRFNAPMDLTIPYELSTRSMQTARQNSTHSYFEDGEDPDENLVLPEGIMAAIAKMNTIHHTGCIIFEVKDNYLKIHTYYRLLDHFQENDFNAQLREIIGCINLIDGEGTCGFMKLPFKDTRHFSQQRVCEDKFYPKNPRRNH